MSTFILKQDPAVPAKFQHYPPEIRPRLEHLRALILQTAAETPSIKALEETLKWGEPSYLVQGGSTIRIDWKSKTPDQYAIYFKCTSKLVPTFKELFGELFVFEKDRAILFQLEEEVPERELIACLKMALCYHSLKHLPQLGA